MSALPAWGDTDEVISIHSRTNSHAAVVAESDAAAAAVSTEEHADIAEEEAIDFAAEDLQEEEEQKVEDDEEVQEPINDGDDEPAGGLIAAPAAAPSKRPAPSPQSTHAAKAAAPRPRSRTRIARRTVPSAAPATAAVFASSSGYGSTYVPQRVATATPARSPYAALHSRGRSAASASAARGLPSLSSLASLPSTPSRVQYHLPTRVSVVERTTSTTLAKVNFKSPKSSPNWKGEIPPNQTQQFDLRLSHPTILSGPLGQGPAPPLPLPGSKKQEKKQEKDSVAAAASAPITLAAVVEELFIPLPAAVVFAAAPPFVRRRQLTTVKRLEREAEEANAERWAQASLEEKEQMLADQRRTVYELRAKTRAARKQREEAWRAQEIPLRRAENAVLRLPEHRLSQYELWWAKEDAALLKWQADHPGERVPADFGRSAAAVAAAGTVPLAPEEQFTEAKFDEDDAIAEPIQATTRGRSRSRSRSRSRTRRTAASSPSPFGNALPLSGRPVDFTVSTAAVWNGNVGIEFKMLSADDPEANAPLWPEDPEAMALHGYQPPNIAAFAAAAAAAAGGAATAEAAAAPAPADDSSPVVAPAVASASVLPVAAVSFSASAAVPALAGFVAAAPSHRSSHSLSGSVLPSDSNGAFAAGAEDDGPSATFSFNDIDDGDDAFPSEEAVHDAASAAAAAAAAAASSQPVIAALSAPSHSQSPSHHPPLSSSPPSAVRSLHPSRSTRPPSQSFEPSFDPFERKSSDRETSETHATLTAAVVTQANSGHIRNSSATSSQLAPQHARSGSSSVNGIAVVAAAPAVPQSASINGSHGGFSSADDHHLEPSRSVGISGLHGGVQQQQLIASEVEDFIGGGEEDDASAARRHSEEPLTVGPNGASRETSRAAVSVVAPAAASNNHSVRNKSFEEDKPALASSSSSIAGAQANHSQQPQGMRTQPPSHSQTPSTHKQQPSFSVSSNQAPNAAAAAAVDGSSTTRSQPVAGAAAMAASTAAPTPSVSVAPSSPVVAVSSPLSSPTAAASVASSPASVLPGTPSEWKADESRLSSGIEATKLPRKTGLFAPKAKQVNLILARNTLGDSWLLHWGSKSKEKEENQLNLSKDLKTFTRGVDKGAFKNNKEWGKKYAQQSESV